jgi:hypothetical protein
MGEHDEVYGAERAERLKRLLRELAQRIRDLDAGGGLLDNAPELLRRTGDLRSELFHYEVRVTYDTPEIAEHRRIVEDAAGPADLGAPDSEDDEPWRQPPE